MNETTKAHKDTQSRTGISNLGKLLRVPYWFHFPENHDDNLNYWRIILATRMQLSRGSKKNSPVIGTELVNLIRLSQLIKLPGHDGDDSIIF